LIALRRGDLTPATIAWLAAVGALAVRWGSPLSGLYSNAILADVFVAIAALLFVVDLARGRTRLVWRPWHLWLVAFIVWQAVAAVAAADRHAAFKELVLVAGLAVLAVITAALAEERAAARALARVVLASVMLTFGLAVVGLALFYAGQDTGLLGRYGDLAESSSYTRVRAGFASAPLLASW